VSATKKTDPIEDALDSVRGEVVSWRRQLHAHPELSFKEFRTAEFVREVLAALPNLKIRSLTPTSVVAYLEGASKGPTLAVRADMDALPVSEEAEVEFVSQVPGVMHACGHDAHTAMLLGAAKILSDRREEIRGNVLFIFQHAEELPPGGAAELVAAGALDGVDAVIGTHLDSLLPVGQIAIKAGSAMAACDEFTITIRGEGGHAARPHLTIDSLAIGAQVVNNLQHIVARNTDPEAALVVSVTEFFAGTADNVIASTAELVGTVRSFDPRLRSEIRARMERIVGGVTAAHGADYAMDYRTGYAPVVNDSRITMLVRDALVEAFGESVVELVPHMGSEDFSAYLQKVPGCFFFIGAGPSDSTRAYAHHHARFVIDEQALQVGVEAVVRASLRLLRDLAIA
jgi:amidohydrolase